MTAVKPRIEVKPDAKTFKANLDARYKKISDFALVHKRAAILLDSWVQRNFKDEGQKLSGNDAWPPFKIGGRRIKGGGIDTAAKLLQDTGELRASHHPFHSAKDAGIGSDKPYAQYHQEGLGHLPMRRTLPEPNEVHKALMKLFDQHVDEALR